MITEKILNKFRNNIINESLHLGHGIKSAKVICHVDLDGVVSGISMVQQLVKQGIPKERINVEFAQYGDEEKQTKIGRDEADKFQPKNKHQWVGVTDYAKYPKVKLWDVFNKVIGFAKDYKNKYNFVKFANSRDFSKIANVEDFRKVFEKEFTIKETKFTEGTIKKLYNGLKAYSTWGEDDVGKITNNNVEEYSIAVVKPDFGSDHHSNDDGVLSAAKRGDLAVSSPSEAEFFANKYAPGLWSKDDLKAVSMIDSAGYSRDELTNTVFLEKHFTGPNKKRNLATIISVIYDNLVKKDEKVAKWIILNSGPSLVSLYSTTLRGLKFNGERLRMLEAIKSGDINTGKEIAAALPKILNKNWYTKDSDNYKNRNGDEIKKGLTVDDWRQKNQKDLENALTGHKSREDDKAIEDAKKKLEDAKAEAKANKRVQKDDPNVTSAKEQLKVIKDITAGKKGKIFMSGSFVFFDGGDKKTQYSRFLPALLSEKGYRRPYIMRYWPTSMFQISVNTLYKKEFPQDKEILNLSIINDHVLKDLAKYLKDEKKMNEFSVNKLISEMRERNGGHKSAIWTFSGFDKIKPTSREIGDDYWDKNDMIKRANEIVAKRQGKDPSKIYGKARMNNAKEIIPNSVEKIEKVDSTVGAKYDQIKKDAFDFAMKTAKYWVEKLYPRDTGSVVKGLKNSDERFEMKS